MRRFVGLIALATGALIPGQSVAHPDSSGHYQIVGYGTESCGTWVEERRDPSKSWSVLADKGWISGFLSAYNVFGPGSGNVRRDTDSDGTSAWIDNYCLAHPLESLSDAVQALVSTLESKGKP